MTNNSAEHLLLRMSEAAESLGVSRAKLYQEVSRGAIKAVHIGSAVRIPSDELRRYVESLKTGNVA
jgi:excisionase family DNA binding protein